MVGQNEEIIRSRNIPNLSHYSRILCFIKVSKKDASYPNDLKYKLFFRLDYFEGLIYYSEEFNDENGKIKKNIGLKNHNYGENCLELNQYSLSSLEQEVYLEIIPFGKFIDNNPSGIKIEIEQSNYTETDYDLNYQIKYSIRYSYPKIDLEKISGVNITEIKQIISREKKNPIEYMEISQGILQPVRIKFKNTFQANPLDSIFSVIQDSIRLNSHTIRLTQQIRLISIRKQTDDLSESLKKIIDAIKQLDDEMKKDNEEIIQNQEEIKRIQRLTAKEVGTSFLEYLGSFKEDLRFDLMEIHNAIDSKIDLIIDFFRDKILPEINDIRLANDEEKKAFEKLGKIATKLRLKKAIVFEFRCSICENIYKYVYFANTKFHLIAKLILNVGLPLMGVTIQGFDNTNSIKKNLSALLDIAENSDKKIKIENAKAIYKSIGFDKIHLSYDKDSQLMPEEIKFLYQTLKGFNEKDKKDKKDKKKEESFKFLSSSFQYYTSLDKANRYELKSYCMYCKKVKKSLSDIIDSLLKINSEDDSLVKIKKEVDNNKIQINDIEQYFNVFEKFAKIYPHNYDSDIDLKNILKEFFKGCYNIYLKNENISNEKAKDILENIKKEIINSKFKKIFFTLDGNIRNKKSI